MQVNLAAEKWHRCAGNWYKVFHIADDDKSGYMEYDNMLKLIRSPLPKLCISHEAISDSDLRAFWKAMDQDRGGTIQVQEFIQFMNRHCSQQNTWFLHDKEREQESSRDHLRQPQPRLLLKG